MPRVFLDISTSLDGFVAGPNLTLEQPLGEGGELLHEWAYRLVVWREPHGLEGGESGPDGDLVRANLERTGAVVMGRRMFSGGEGPWQDDPNADAWWGDNPPFRVPVFVVTHHPRETVVKEGGTTFTFVTEGVESAVALAGEAAGDKDVAIAGGANVAQQVLQAGLLDELHVHIAPVLLGDGVRLFGELPGERPRLKLTNVLDTPLATHLGYEVVR